MEQDIYNFKSSNDYLKNEDRMIELINEMTFSKNDYEKKKLIFENRDYKNDFTNEEIRRIKELINF